LRHHIHEYDRQFVKGGNEQMNFRNLDYKKILRFALVTALVAVVILGARKYLAQNPTRDGKLELGEDSSAASTASEPKKAARGSVKRIITEAARHSSGELDEVTRDGSASEIELTIVPLPYSGLRRQASNALWYAGQPADFHAIVLIGTSDGKLTSGRIVDEEGKTLMELEQRQFINFESYFDYHAKNR
jgi:hypothetical protein